MGAKPLLLMYVIWACKLDLSMLFNVCTFTKSNSSASPRGQHRSLHVWHLNPVPSYSRVSLHPPRLGHSRARWGRRRSRGPPLAWGCRRWRGWCAACGGPSRPSPGPRSYTRQSCSGWRRTAHPAKSDHTQGVQLQPLASNTKCTHRHTDRWTGRQTEGYIVINSGRRDRAKREMSRHLNRVCWYAILPGPCVWLCRLSTGMHAGACWEVSRGSLSRTDEKRGPWERRGIYLWKSDWMLQD